MSRAKLLEAWLAPTSVKYHDNLLILMLLNRWLALTMLRTTGPISLWRDETREKPSNQGNKKLNQHETVGNGVEPGSQSWEASA